MLIIQLSHIQFKGERRIKSLSGIQDESVSYIV